MRQIDEQFLEKPLFVTRQMTWHLRTEGHLVNAKHLRRLMRLKGRMPIYQKPKMSMPVKGHKTYLHLLAGMGVTLPNQFFVGRHRRSADARGVSLSGRIMDWQIRKVLA